MRRLGVPLRDHEREVVFACDVVEAGAPENDLSGTHRSAVSPQTRIEKGSRAAHPVHEFEGSAPDHDCFRFVGARGRLLDNAHRDTKAGQLQRHGQTDRPRARDQRLDCH